DVTSYAYANQAGTGAGNFLHTITDANNVVIATYTYDTAGRVATYTDSQGYTLSYSYDNANRLTQITYPDGTTTKYGYTNLDLTSVTDRLGRTTTYTYDANRKLISVKDPLGHTMTYGYDPDGRLTSLTDPMGHVTTWTRDLEGRIVTKTYPDGTTTNYTYDITGRLATRVDALHQTTTYSYATDDLLSSKTYTNTVNPTPNVTYTWDSAYPRLASMTDGSGPGGGTGTTAFTYWPVGYAGALQSAQEQGPNGSADTYLNVYDTLGRFWGRFTGGLTVSDTYLTYDAINRPTSDITPMGTFNYNYLGETQQISSWGLASGATTATINYQPNADDRRYLQT
ncbi:MAG: RHS repeat protein, partial [Xanthomonadaceae bacterium]|nr:RHS repeat protein [Xanthomonadaceae bacterium]